MSSPVNDLPGVRAKIKRAREHVHQLETAIVNFRESNPYGFKIDEDGTTGDKVHRLQIREATPARFALLIGDAVHNLRSALDHLAWQLVLSNGNTPKSGPGGTQFPISIPSPKAKSRQGVIQGISPSAQQLIDALKPYMGGHPELWSLHQLDVTDKHKILLVTAFALSAIMPTWKGNGVWKAMRAHISSLTPKDGVVDLRLRVEGPYCQDFSICVPIGAQEDGSLPILSHDAVVARLHAPIQQEAKFDLAFEIAINEPSISINKPVVPLLFNLVAMVEGVVDQFVPLS